MSQQRLDWLIQPVQHDGLLPRTQKLSRTLADEITTSRHIIFPRTRNDTVCPKYNIVVINIIIFLIDLYSSQLVWNP